MKGMRHMLCPGDEGNTIGIHKLYQQTTERSPSPAFNNVDKKFCNHKLVVETKLHDKAEDDAFGCDNFSHEKEVFSSLEF